MCPYRIYIFKLYIIADDLSRVRVHKISYFRPTSFGLGLIIKFDPVIFFGTDRLNDGFLSFV